MNASKPINDDVDAAISRLLREAPEVWAELDQDGLTATEQEALGLLTAAAMIERRFSVRLSLIGHAVRLSVTATATGDHGLLEAMEPVLRKAWNIWGEFVADRRDRPKHERPLVFCEKTGPDMWRLTPDGVLGRKDLDEGRSESVFDFVHRRAPVFEGVVVPGHGRAERLETEREAETPTKVEVTNLAEITGPLKDMAEALQKGLEALAAAGVQAPKEGVASVETGTKGSDAAPAKRGKRGPARMPLEEAWRYLLVVQEWADHRERNKKLSMQDRYRKVQLADKHDITPKKLDAMLGWYAKHKREKRFPDDPRTLSRGELKQWFE